MKPGFFIRILAWQPKQERRAKFFNIICGNSGNKVPLGG
jgi:hypothetical protein